MAQTSRRNGFLAAPLMLLFVVLLFLSTSRATPEASPIAEVEMICHTDHRADCYPKVFQPTHEFREVHDDQVIPHGLHVRFDMQTGLKQAKIAVEGEENPELAMVLFDKDRIEEEPVIPSGAPAYESIGKIKPPSDEPLTFHDGLKVLQGASVYSQSVLDGAMESVLEFAHDIYYGLKIAEEKAVMKNLFCIMSTNEREVSDDPSQMKLPPHGAAQIVAAAVQNNAKALEEVVKSWDDIMSSNCEGVEVRSLWNSSFFIPKSLAVSEATLMKSRISTIHGLIKNEKVRTEFLGASGMPRLLELLSLDTSAPAWDTVKEKIALSVMDNFLDEDMGAVLGVWPTNGAQEAMAWRAEVELIRKANKAEKSHWSNDFLRMLNAKAKVTNKSAGKVADKNADNGAQQPLGILEDVEL